MPEFYIPELSNEQLQQWYKNFSDTLYRDAKLDVTRKEDLGRVQHFYVIGRSAENPRAATDFIGRYSYMPMVETEYLVPEPSITKFEEYTKWMMDNLDPNIGIDQIRELHKLSCLGLLMVRSPGDEETIDGNRQVLTDKNGNVRVTLSTKELTANYRKDVPEDQKPLPTLDVVKPPQLPKGFPEEPGYPEPPENMNPGFWSRVGYIFGLNTDYAKLMRYEKDKASFAQRHRAWETEVANRRGELTEYFAQKELYDEYLMELDKQLRDPRSTQDAVSVAFNTWFMGLDVPGEELKKIRTGYENEPKFLNKLHQRTPMATMEKALNTLQETQAHSKNFDDALRHLLGPEATEFPLWIQRKVYSGKDSYDPAPYQLTDKPTRISAEELEALAPLACFAALSHPDVAGVPAIADISKEDTAKLNYGHVLNDIFTSGRFHGPEGSPYMKLLPPARQMGAAAANAYAMGDVQPLAQLLQGSIRQTCAEVRSTAACGLDSSHAANSCYSVSKMLELLDKDPELMQAADLNPEELQEARAIAAYHKILCKAQESNGKLLEYCLRRRELSPQELESAVCDVLFAGVVNQQMQAEYNQWSQVRSADPDFQKRQDILAKNNFLSAKQQAEEARKTNDPSADMKQHLYELLAADYAYVSALQNLTEYTCPPSAMRAKLLDAQWMHHSRQQMTDVLSRRNLSGMDRNELGTVCSNYTTQFVSAFCPKARQQAAQLQNEPQLQNDAPAANPMNI